MSILSKLGDFDSRHYVVGVCASVLVVRYLMKKPDFPTHFYPAKGVQKSRVFSVMLSCDVGHPSLAEKQANFEIVKKSKLPPIFWGNGFFPLNIKKVLVITDFHDAENLFKRSTFSNRLNSSKTTLDLDNSAKRYGFDRLADELGLKHSRVTSNVAGIAAGSHRKFFFDINEINSQKTIKKN